MANLDLDRTGAGLGRQTITGYKTRQQRRQQLVGQPCLRSRRHLEKASAHSQSPRVRSQRLPTGPNRLYPRKVTPFFQLSKINLQNILHDFLKRVLLNSVRNNTIEREIPTTPHTNPKMNMKRKIIVLGAITLIALIPVAILSVDEASASRTSPLAAASDSLPSSTKAKTIAPVKKEEKNKVAATRSTPRTSSKSKASPSTGHSSQASSKKQSSELEKQSKEQRQAKEKIADLTTTQKSKMLVLLNEGDTEQLASIKGISTTRANAIEKARPFSSIDEIVLVRGIGETTFAEVIAHARSLTARRSSSSSAKSKTSKS